MATTTFDVSASAVEGSSEEKAVSLQGAFQQYRNKRQDELRERQRLEQLSLDARADPGRMAELRSKFLQRAKSYMGIPYAKRYHTPDSPTHNAPLFLDCCGLVRRVLLDLKEEFGFTIGRWNQAYMFDTLPITLSGPDEMKPGDLVFVSGIYNKERAKKQRHNMVHVEIWLGEGHTCLGARWQKRFVEVHESYQFVSKSYHSMTYHFKSIDTWLKGVCESVCLEHLWKIRKFDPSKKSIFALSEEACDSCDDGEECDSGEPCEDDSEPLEETGPVAVNQDPQTTTHHKKSKKVTSHRAMVSTPSTAGLARTFLTCGGNASSLVESALTKRGWVHCEDKASTTFTLKWTELKGHIDYKLFKVGEQMVNHFPNIGVLTTKIGLLESLRSYCKIHKPPIRLDLFFPLTYRLDIRTELEEFLSCFTELALCNSGGPNSMIFYKELFQMCCILYTEGELWICKPTGANQGKGIFLVRQLSEVTEKLEWDKAHCKLTARPTPRIVQRYISNPLLLDGRKFDIRVYMLLLGAQPFVVLYRDGYVRLCCESYQLSSDSLTVHLTNQYQQKKLPIYSEVKEDTVWSFDKFQSTLSTEYDLPGDWVQSTLKRRMISIMSTCYHSVRHKLSPTNGQFDLLGFDFMLDTELNVWLIEINVNPALHTNCGALATLSPSVVSETLDIAIEVFDKNRRNKPILPLTSLKHFIRTN